MRRVEIKSATLLRGSGSTQRETAIAKWPQSMPDFRRRVSRKIAPTGMAVYPQGDPHFSSLQHSRRWLWTDRLVTESDTNM